MRLCHCHSSHCQDASFKREVISPQGYQDPFQALSQGPIRVHSFSYIHFQWLLITKLTRRLFYPKTCHFTKSQQLPVASICILTLQITFKQGHSAAPLTVESVLSPSFKYVPRKSFPVEKRFQALVTKTNADEVITQVLYRAKEAMCALKIIQGLSHYTNYNFV